MAGLIKDLVQCLMLGLSPGLLYVAEVCCCMLLVFDVLVCMLYYVVGVCYIMG